MSEARDWVQLLRASNLATVASNALVGSAIASVSWTASHGHLRSPPHRDAWTPLLLAVGSLLLIYLGGMALNDAAGATRDRTAGRDRPVARGDIARRDAWILGFALLGGGVAVAIPMGLTSLSIAAGLAVLVLAYSAMHQWAVAAVVLMAACRAAIYPLAAYAGGSSVDPSLLVLPCAGIALYTALITIIGRVEGRGGRPMANLVWLMLLAAVIPAIALCDVFALPWLMIALLVYAIWLMAAWRPLAADPPRVAPGMHTLLSGFALLDAVYLVAIGEPALAPVAFVCCGLTVVAHRLVPGT